MTPEILIVGDPAGRRQLADLVAASGYGVALCAPRDLNRRVRTGAPPAAIVACMADLDADVLLAGLRRTRPGASIPVILYGRFGGPLRDLADVLDLGADAFLEEPANERELREALGQFVRPAELRPAARGREPEELVDHRRGPDDRGRAPGRGRPDPRDREREREREDDPQDRGRDAQDARHERDRGPERSDSRRPRGQALGDLHRTLDRLEASLRTDDHRSDPELAALGFDDIPDVDPQDDAPLVTDVGEHMRGRPRSFQPVRGDGLTDPTDPAPARHPPERPRPRASRELPPERPHRAEPDPSAETGSGRRSWREPSEETGSFSQRDGMRTRTWDRSDHEGPLRRGRERPEDPARAGRERPEDPARGARSSAVLLGRRPDRDAVRSEPDALASPRTERLGEIGEGTGRFRATPREPALDPSPMTDRLDPHARDAPWPEEDFDPSESTMIRRERSSATTRRRSLGGWGEDRRSEKPDARDSILGRAGRDGESTSSGSTTRPRPPARPEPERPREQERAREPERSRELERPREPERSRELERTRELERAREPERTREPERAREPSPEPVARRRVGRGLPTTTTTTAEPALRIDPSLRESGKLSPDVDVATVLWALHDQRFTGKLRLVRARVEKQIWLHDGEAVFARSTATSDRLVDGLLRRGVLTRPQYETARRLAAKEPRRAGQLLVDAGFLKARELDVLLRDHLARVIDSTFVWADGTWSTEPGDRTDEATQLEVPMAALILDGIRYRCDASELEDRLTRRLGGRGPLVPRLRARPEQLGGDERAALDELIETLGETFRLLPEEESWLRRFDGRHGVAALLADGADEQALFALLFTLELAGCVDLREQPEPVVEGDRDGAQVDAERILERLRLAREADYFELLGVARDASRSEIRQAYSELGATFGDDALEENSRRRHARELRELRAALEEARDILIDDAMRSAYLAHLGDST